MEHFCFSLRKKHHFWLRSLSEYTNCCSFACVRACERCDHGCVSMRSILLLLLRSCVLYLASSVFFMFLSSLFSKHPTNYWTTKAFAEWIHSKSSCFVGMSEVLWFFASWFTIEIFLASNIHSEYSVGKINEIKWKSEYIHHFTFCRFQAPLRRMVKWITWR